MLSGKNTKKSARKVHNQEKRSAAKKVTRRAGKQPKLSQSPSGARDPKLLALRVMKKSANRYLTSDW